MIHAGLLPQWTTQDAAQLACEVETALRGDGFQSFLRSLFHEPAVTWNPNLTGVSRLVTVARVLTRLRTCTPAGDTSNFSGPPEETPPGYFPWFRLPARRSADTTIITGHWAALGLHMEPNLLAIDSGCVWGRQLTAVRLEDRQVFQVNCGMRYASVGSRTYSRHPNTRRRGGTSSPIPNESSPFTDSGST